MLFKDKITRKAFEEKLLKEYGSRLSMCSHGEYDINGKETKVLLYYVDGIHAGSWCKGSGWIFDHMKDFEEFKRKQQEMYPGLYGDAK